MRVRALLTVALLMLGVLVPGAPASADSSLTGPDVAVYQHPNNAPIDWNAVRRDGRRFAFVKATQATTYTNPYFASDWRGIAAAGLFRGAYHYAKPSAAAGSATAQADYFASTIGGQLVSGTLPPVLDLEDAGGLSVSALTSWVQSFLSEVQARTGRLPMLYTYPAFWRNSMGSSTAFTGYPLWIANYAPSPQDIGWPRYTFWQYTSTATVGGITTTGHTDLSTFNGTSTDLSALALAGTWRPPTQTVSEQPAPTSAPVCGGFGALAPQRVLDTRSAGTGPATGSVTITLPDSVPADAVGVQLDVTAVEATGPGYLRVGPAGTAPMTTALTYGAGRSTTGLVTTSADGNRQVTVTVYGTAVDLVVDVVGSFGPTGGAQWFAAEPARVADTRTGQGLAAGKQSGPADLDLSATLPATATGVVLDVSAVNPGGAGFVRLAAAGSAPTTTALNYDAAGSTTGLAVTTTSGGHVTISVNGAPTHLVVDLLGWFDTSIAAGGQYCPVTPTRFLDTRTGLGATGPGTGPLGLATPSTVPDTAAAVVLDVSAVDPSSAGFVRVTTIGQEPTTTALNVIPRRSVTGLVVVPLNDAQLVLAAYQADLHLVADVVGYLGSPPTG